MPKVKESVSIIGAGSWGTTLAVLLARRQRFPVTLWSPFVDQIEVMERVRENRQFLPGMAFPEQLAVTSDITRALESHLVIIAVPVQYMRDALKSIARSGQPLKDRLFVSVSKGIELASLTTPFDMIREELRVAAGNVAVLSGPTIAKEVAAGIPAVAVAACRKDDNAQRIQSIFEGTPLRVYRNNDVVGVEYSGALKNVIAIACGISDGLGFGTNTKSALVCRGLKEMIRFAKLYKAKEETFWGVAGLGDLATTCFSPDSRNRTLGERIGKGESLNDILSGMKMVAEGVATSKSLYALSRKHKIDMPISLEVYNTLFKNKSPQKAVESLMNRPLKAE
jgi:glycerol-3-phosphate dehydrogenase (NAD(P)+)